jgi:hypothetical protein
MGKQVAGQARSPARDLFGLTPRKHEAPDRGADKGFHHVNFAHDDGLRNSASPHLVDECAQRLTDAVIRGNGRSFPRHCRCDFVDDIALPCDRELHHRRRRAAGAWRALNDAIADDAIAGDRHAARPVRAA